MKNIKYIILGCIVVFSSASCKKWLDVNTDPDSPNNQSVLIQNRLPWIEHFYQYTSGIANYRTSCQAGVYIVVLQVQIHLVQHGNVIPAM